jgi:hypothetical protein
MMAREVESEKYSYPTNSHKLFEDYFRSRPDIGFLKMLLDLTLEPRNSFKPWEARKVKKGFVVTMLFLLVAFGWFGYFSLVT